MSLKHHPKKVPVQPSTNLIFEPPSEIKHLIYRRVRFWQIVQLQIIARESLFHFLTVIRDSGELISAIHLLIILQKISTGVMEKEAVLTSLKISIGNIIIQSDQYLGTSRDGHFQHCHVHTLVDEAFGVIRHHDYDPMHKAGRQDIHIRKDQDFKWLCKMTKVF